MSISSFLIRCGVDPSIIGFFYLSEAIRIKIKNPRERICKIYDSVAQTFCVSAAAVERAMRYAVNRALDKFGAQYLSGVLGQPPALDGGYDVRTFIGLAALRCAE